MPGHLQDELPVAALVKELSVWQTAYRQPAQDKRTRAEAQRLFALVAVRPNQFDALDLPKAMLRDDELRLGPPEDGAGLFYGGCSTAILLVYTVGKCIVQ